jgi:UDP-N-acetylglucosamine--N-acetylmuramyl-(pentapeptide) pyrophosphoryl-undecaprenol N-acetylglucosamine transferase
MAGPLVLVAAGGTGGHLFPAESLASALKPLGARVVLATDERVGELADAFPAEEVVEIPSATPSGRSVPKVALAALTIGRGTWRAMREIKRLRPDVVIGFGGYPTVPPVLAASLLKIPTALHEQNGVMGRANRFLAGRVSLLATGFDEVRGVPPGAKARRVHTGNPVRPAVIAAASRPFEPLGPGGVLRLLAFGGSQGARVMSDVVPAAVALLPQASRARLSLTQQARPEDLERVRALYAQAGVEADVQPFFRDLPGRIAASHLVVSRSGASTVAELGVIGRPSILVPLPGAIDQDQAANAASLATIGAGAVIPQPEFTPERLAAEIAARLHDPQRLTDAARAAKSAGIADAAERLAAALLDLAGPARPGQSGR